MTYTRNSASRYVNRDKLAVKKARQKTCDHDPVLATEGLHKGSMVCRRCGLVTPNHTEPKEND